MTERDQNPGQTVRRIGFKAQTRPGLEAFNSIPVDFRALTFAALLVLSLFATGAWTQDFQGKVNEGVFELNLRTQGSLSGKIITQIHSGQRFKVTDEANGWYAIELPDGTQGWVFGKYVTVTRSSSSVKLVFPADGASLSNSSVDLKWSSGGHPGPFRVLVKETNGQGAETPYMPAASGFKVKNLKKGSSYRWMVAPVTGDRVGEYTQPWSFTVGKPSVSGGEAPSIQAVFVVSSVPGAASAVVPSSESKTVASTAKVNLYAVVETVKDGKTVHYLGDTTSKGADLPSQAVIYRRATKKSETVALQRWDAKAWGSLEFNWGRITARPYHVNLSHYTGADSPQYVWYTNVVPNGPTEGQWWKWDTVEYKEEKLQGERSFLSYILPFLSAKNKSWTAEVPRPRNGGTAWYKVAVGSPKAGEAESYGRFTSKFESSANLGEEDYFCGIALDVHRVTFLGESPSGLVRGVLAYQGVPWIYGSANIGGSHGHQTERFAGFDCADLAMGAWNLAVDRSFRVNSGAHTLAMRVTSPMAFGYLDLLKPGASDGRGGKVRVHTFVDRNAIEVIVPVAPAGSTDNDKVAEGDLIFFDWNKDGKYDHTTVFYADGQSRPGFLSPDDLLLWASHDGVVTKTLQTLLHSESNRLLIRKWKK